MPGERSGSRILIDRNPTRRSKRCPLRSTTTHCSYLKTPDEQYALRANRFAVEFALPRVALRGSGREYQLLDAIAETAYPIILPVDFPKPPNVATPEAAQDATLSELMHWHLAPENPVRLRDAGVTIAFTTAGVDDKQKFREHIRTAVERGLSLDDALAASTTVPAKLFGLEDKVGTIAAGKLANLMICDGDWLAEKTKVVETWVDGQRFEHDPAAVNEVAGTWKLTLESDGELFVHLEEKDGKLSGEASTTEPEEATAKETKDAKASDDADGDKEERRRLPNLFS